MFNFVKSIFIGIALVVPGLSGSMFALCTGLYDGIIHYAGHFTKDIRRSITFLLPVLLGCLVGIFASAGLVLHICGAYSFQSYAFFIGLTLGGLPMIYRRIRREPLTLGNTGLCVLCMLLALITARYAPGGGGYVAMEGIGSGLDFLAIFAAGLVSCALMTMPGVSGSIVLMLMAQYGTVYNAASQAGLLMARALTGDFAALGGMAAPGMILLAFGLGAFIGIACAARLISRLLKTRATTAYYGVFGLILGAAAALFSQGVSDALGAELTRGGTGAFISAGIMVIFILLGVLCTMILNDGDNGGVGATGLENGN